MTLDTLTRANAERKHQQLKNSLAQTRAAFGEQFLRDDDLFRSLPLPTSPIHAIRPRSSSAHTVTNGESSSPSAPQSTHDAEDDESTFDLVRAERLAQCCKRVRLWRRRPANPMLQYKQQQLHFSTKLGGKTSSSDHRMHLSLLVTMIVDIYEHKMATELQQASAAAGAPISSAALFARPVMGGIAEPFSEFVIKFFVQRSPSRRAAIEMLHSTVATLLQPSSHTRIRVFASLCGMDDRFHPPETIRTFLHLVDVIYRHKIAATANMAHVRFEETSTSAAEVVFHNVGVPLAVVDKVIAELFREDDYYWHFGFWASHVRELGVVSDWPRRAKLELEERALALAAVTRNPALHASRKIDGDAFLELLLDTWNQRARMLADALEAATDREEKEGRSELARARMVQATRGQIPPATADETQLFERLVQKYWNANVPWASVSVQRLLTFLKPLRAIEDLATLYRRHVAALAPEQRVWDWRRWHWDTDWEWSALVVQEGHASDSEAIAGGTDHDDCRDNGGVLSEIMPVQPDTT